MYFKVVHITFTSNSYVGFKAKFEFYSLLTLHLQKLF